MCWQTMHAFHYHFNERFVIPYGTLQENNIASGNDLTLMMTDKLKECDMIA